LPRSRHKNRLSLPEIIKLTAKAVAQEIGFKLQEENILEGKDLDKLSDEEFDKILNKIKIYARVEPKHKMRNY